MKGVITLKVDTCVRVCGFPCAAYVRNLCGGLNAHLPA